MLRLWPGFLGVLFLFLTLLPCSKAWAQEISVAAAASLRDALVEIQDAYQQKHRTKLHLSFGGSGQLMLQIRQGAPVDVFISAAIKPITELQKENLLTDDEPVTIAGNALVMVVREEIKSPLTDWQSLTATHVRHIAIGQPRAVPAGEYAMEVFESLKLTDALRPKLVMGSDVRQVLALVARGEVDAGVVYQSDAWSARTLVRVVTVAPPGSHGQIVYPAAIVRRTHNLEKARKFLQFLRRSESQRILSSHHFVALEPPVTPSTLTTQPAP